MEEEGGFVSVTFDSSSTGCVQSCSIPRRVGMCKRGRRVEVSLNASAATVMRASPTPP